MSIIPSKKKIITSLNSNDDENEGLERGISQSAISCIQSVSVSSLLRLAFLVVLIQTFYCLFYTICNISLENVSTRAEIFGHLDQTSLLAVFLELFHDRRLVQIFCNVVSSSDIDKPVG